MQPFPLNKCSDQTAELLGTRIDAKSPRTVLSLTSPCSEQPHHLAQHHPQWLYRNKCRYHMARFTAHAPVTQRKDLGSLCVWQGPPCPPVPRSVYFPSLCFLISLGGCDSAVPRCVHHKRIPGMDYRVTVIVPSRNGAQPAPTDGAAWPYQFV